MASTGMWWRIGLLVLLVLADLLGPLPGGVGAEEGEPPAAGFFPETGQLVAPDFLATWRAGGGLTTFGLPITEERSEIGEEDGREYRVQWFERARFERHPEFAGTPQAVQLGLLGRQLSAGRAPAPADPAALGAGLFFPETGRAVEEPFLSFWQEQGGLPIFGYPVTGRLYEVSADDGRARSVQYFERARLEDHGPAASPRVQAGLVGREALARPVRLRWEAEEALAHTFTTALVQTGGLLSQDQALYVRSREPAAGDGVYRARYSLRVPRPGTYQLWARLLLSEEAAPLYWRVDGGAWAVADAAIPALLPAEAVPDRRYGWQRLAGLALTAGTHAFEVEVAPAIGRETVAGLDAFALMTEAGPPAARAGDWRPGQQMPAVVDLRAEIGAAGMAWPRLHRGLAQGGEQRDPAYLARVAPRLRALGTEYIRLDHVFDYYDVLRREPDGRLAYDFTRLDAALDAVLAAGAQPVLSLGLTPALLSPTGAENEPPDDLRRWRALVTATVRHVNGERGLGVRYWEVWNEPNLAPFWAGSFQDYLRLYRATAAAVVAADPTVKVGGPATAGHEFWVAGLIDWAAATGTRLDFVSWHLYHVHPVMAANQAALVARWLARYPQFRDTELVVSEWSLHSDFGERAGYVSDSHRMAAYLAAMSHTLTDAGVRRALFFEAVDGAPPAGQLAWGRWGVLTHDGQPKPAYHALTALARLHDGRVPAASSDPRVGLLATRQGDRLALLVWSLAPPDQAAPIALSLSLTRPPAGLTTLRRWSIGATHSRLGGQLEEIEPLRGTAGSDTWRATLMVEPASVTLLTWEP